MKKGLFVAIYGINNIGKSTHARRLVTRLVREGYDAVYLKYPVYDLKPTGPKINSILRSESGQKVSEEELQTLFMQNRRDFEPTLKNYLAQGKFVVAEDYTGTGLAWGTAKGLKLGFMEDLNKGLLKEDLAILLTGKRDIRAMEKTHIHERDDLLISKVSHVLLQLAKKYGWVKISLQVEIDDTARLVWKEMSRFLEKTDSDNL